MTMSEYQKIADKINNTEDYEDCLDDMRALCRAAGMDEELAKRPDDSDWVWEVAWQAAQKLDVHIDTPYFHFYEDFRIEVKSSETEDVHGVKRHYACPVFWDDDYFTTKDKLKQLSAAFDEGMRIVGVEKEPDSLIKTHAEAVLTTDEFGKGWTYLDEYVKSLEVEKIHLLRCLKRINLLLKEASEGQG